MRYPMSDDLKFIEGPLPPKAKPTRSGGRPSVWPDRLNTIMNRPGEWAELSGSGKAGYTSVRNAVLYHYGREALATNWEITRRSGTIYARYNPPTKET